MKKLDVGNKVWVIGKRFNRKAKFGEPLEWRIVCNEELKIEYIDRLKGKESYILEKPKSSCLDFVSCVHDGVDLFTNKSDALSACRIRNTIAKDLGEYLRKRRDDLVEEKVSK